MADTPSYSDLNTLSESDFEPLPDHLQSLADDYADVINHRDPYLWKWFYNVSPHFRLSCVPAQHQQTVREQKLLLTFYITLLDDLADHYGDSKTFNEVRKLPFSQETTDRDKPGVWTEYCEFTENIWKQFETDLTTSPRFNEFEEIFKYDIRQSVNAMHYGLLVNDHPEALNMAESRRYGPHNMVVYGYSGLDLMYSPSFDKRDFGELRDVIWDIQRLGRIGNWVSTWERELPEGDYTSGVVISALEDDVISLDELEDDTDREALVDRIDEHDHEQQLLEEWEALFEELKQAEYTTETVDIHEMVSGMQMVLSMHLSSRGQK